MRVPTHRGPRSLPDFPAGRAFRQPGDDSRGQVTHIFSRSGPSQPPAPDSVGHAPDATPASSAITQRLPALDPDLVEAAVQALPLPA